MEISIAPKQVEKTIPIGENLYRSFERLGLIPNEVRKGHVGQSNYSQHIIQPWSIWLDYNLNAWDADIVKRVLRTKTEPGLTEKESRKLDYEKIIHICNERIRQLDLEPEVVISVPFVSTPLIGDSVKIWEDDEVKGEVVDTYTKSVETPKYSDVSYKLSVDEYKAYKDFQKQHKTCSGETQICFTPTAGIGISCAVRCTGCGEERDITDYNAW
jgi:hypothetical protein